MPAVLPIHLRSVRLDVLEEAASSLEVNKWKN